DPFRNEAGDDRGGLSESGRQIGPAERRSRAGLLQKVVETSEAGERQHRRPEPRSARDSDRSHPERGTPPEGARRKDAPRRGRSGGGGRPGQEPPAGDRVAHHGRLTVTMPVPVIFSARAVP